ncbi:MAG TPA: fibronectin type III domain-containing protein [Hymenobacter sp.]|uniref:fibronectin type III domain-containing protein n=1 Tax=Hymenobacter sp. TaxID=1898978 RepID=UPI002D7EC072|nr:fibronectin type III domain-containing protein [Hymenobacter sp.]HET9503483.1 fibronectin type III domain-containing protein [Hymenobacter sp.]
MQNLNSLASGLRAALRRSLPGVLGVGVAFAAQAQQTPASFFSDDAAARQAAATSPLKAALAASRPLTLNVAGLRAALATAPLESRAGTQALLLTLPLPGGTNATFRVQEAPVMAPALAAQFPGIKTYVGVGVQDPTATLRLDLTPQGFHAQVLSPRTGAFYIDPASRADTQHYLSFWKRDMPGNSFACDVVETATKGSTGAKGAAGTAQRAVGPTLRTYRLAVAATGEYTRFHCRTLPAGSTAADSVAAGQAAIVTSINRVVGVYEKELAVRLVLIANNSQLVYIRPNADPYTNNSGSAMLAQNQTSLDALVGAANYDVGHVFSTASGGVAGLGVVCRNGQKARGTTGTSSPVADAFDIDYVAHELGHQFGGSHTFDGNAGSCAGGNRSAAYAYEPGSGTTIMAYAGICGALNNTQVNSDAYFHVASYDQILDYLSTTSCAATTSVANNPPTPILPASGKVLPISTPFKLTAGGYDSDGDAITYCWEQYDRAATTRAPGDAQVAGVTSPIFRSYYPTTDPTRYFPRLSDLVSNTVTLGERLPTVSRPLNFRLTLRDRFTAANTGLGVVGGVNSGLPILPVSLTTTSAAGPFLVTSPNTGVTLPGGSSQVITWDVAGTTANGVNCANVNIRLSTDGGLTYPTVLLANTANDGSEAVTLPSVATTTARIMVEAADNYFFDISNADFIISAPTVACGAPTGVAVSAITATTATLSFVGGTSATGYTITTVPATTTVTATASPVNLTGLISGTTYTVSVQSSCAGAAISTAATATFSTTPPPVCNEATGFTFTGVTGTSATVSFTSPSAATNYFITLLPGGATQTVTSPTASFTGLTPGVAYTVIVQTNCSAGGVATTSAQFGTTPSNDACTSAVALTVNPTCVGITGSISGATQSQAASSCSGGASTTANDVWYSFVATSPLHRVSVTAAFDAVVETLSGSCGTLTSVACVDANASGTENLNLTGLTVGTTYYVRVFAYTTNTAPVYGTFTVCVVPVCPAPSGLTVSNLTATSATVSFVGGASATGYTVTTSPATTTYTATASPVNLTGLAPGTTYTVSVVSACLGNTTSTATVSLTTTTPTATQSAFAAGQVSVAPNPAHGSFTLTLPALGSQRTAQATLLNVLGQAVATRTIALTATGATAEFSTRALAPGMYVLRLVAGAETVVQRVAVE